jgi:hypothetical protein
VCGGSCHNQLFYKHIIKSRVVPSCCFSFRNSLIPDNIQGHVIGNEVALVLDEELITLDREELFIKLNLPIGLGNEKRKYFYYGLIDKIEKHELKPPPKDDQERFEE